MSDIPSHHKFINPLCSVNNTVSGCNKNEVEKQEFYNCVVRDEWRDNKWTCYGPYLNSEDATALKGIAEIPKHNKSILVPVSAYLPHRIDIMNTLIRHSFPQVVIKSIMKVNNQGITGTGDPGCQDAPSKK
jgi:hypothetical protein